MAENSFFYMGGYAFFVWTSYAITAIVLISNLWVARKQFRDTVNRLRKIIKRESS